MNKKNNFLITCYGRSGSKFLSSVMNKSKTWTVKHEPRGNMDENSVGNKTYQFLLEKNYRQDYYGEVNSYMRFHFENMNVGKKGIIIRDPVEIFLSVANRKPVNKHLFHVKQINHWYEQFEKYLEEDKNIMRIDFNQMTTDRGYLQIVVNYFGIDDLFVKENLLKKKVNQNKYIKYKSIDDLNLEVKTLVVRELLPWKDRMLIK